MSSSPTTVPGSTTTAGSANWSLSSRNSASPSPKPTPAGTASQPAGAGTPAEPEPQPPDRVGQARLTCGRPVSQPPFAQLRVKRENLTEFLQVTCTCTRDLPGR